MSLDTIISFQDVPVFQKESLILSDVTFNLEKGEFLYIIGKTGTGKSSLLKTIYAELPVTAGSASVAGYDLLNEAVLEDTKLLNRFYKKVIKRIINVRLIHKLLHKC